MRNELLQESFISVYGDERVSEIVIIDDCSDMVIFDKILAWSKKLPKIRLFRNLKNRDCYENKMTAVAFAKNDFCILLDSDNIIDTSYIDRIFEIKEWDRKIAYMPSFAEPLFNYKAYEGVTFTRENIAEYIGKDMVSTCLNCMNYFVNCTEYTRVWQADIDPHTADSILQNYNWMAAGNGIYIVPDLKYHHRVHDGSHYKQNVHKTGNLYDEIEQKIKLLK